MFQHHNNFQRDSDALENETKMKSLLNALYLFELLQELLSADRELNDTAVKLQLLESSRVSIEATWALYPLRPVNSVPPPLTLSSLLVLNIKR